MFARILEIRTSEVKAAAQAGSEHALGSPRPAADTPRGELVPLAWLDHFCMRNFTNAAIFDDTLPRADGVIEAGFHVPAEALAEAMQAWFRRKGWLRPDECLLVTEKSREGLSRAKPTAE